MRKTIIAIIVCCAAGSLQAQQHYTLKSCLETGLEKNYSIRMVRNEEQISKSNATLGNAGSVETLTILKPKHAQPARKQRLPVCSTRP